RSLRAAKVKTERMRMSSRPTGCACIYVMPSGANSIVLSPGANADLDAAMAVSALADITPDDFLLAQLEIPLATVEVAFAHAARIGATTVLDPTRGSAIPPSLIAHT